VLLNPFRHDVPAEFLLNMHNLDITEDELGGEEEAADAGGEDAEASDGDSGDADSKQGQQQV